MTLPVPDLLADSGLDEAEVRRVVAAALSGADDGELFLEYREAESLVFDNGRLKGANFDTSRGFGLRAVAGEASGYAQSGEISMAALKRAADAASAVAAGHSGRYDDAPAGTNERLYGDQNPAVRPDFSEKARLLAEVDAFARGARSARSTGERVPRHVLAGRRHPARRRTSRARHPPARALRRLACGGGG